MTLTLIVAFFVVLATGILIVPFLWGIFSLGTSEIFIRKVHTISGIIMGLLSIVHIWLEFRFMKMLKKKGILK